MTYRRFFIVCVTILYCVGNTVWAASDTFLVRTLIGADTTPPTVPTSVVATAVAISQIDLSWATSTDDVLVSGYQIFRDGLQIGTSTTLTYSDIGLTPNSTHSYYVTAFDSSNNISASSSIVSTTTFSVPVVSEESHSYGSLMPFSTELIRLMVTPGQTSTRIAFDTEQHVRTVIRWGRTSSYEIGSLELRSFSQHHETEITGLTPGTVYYISIEGEDKFGRSGVFTEDTFVTLPADDVTPPTNVTGLQLTEEEGDIRLDWTNPDDLDFAYIRVLRSTQFYPQDTLDGWVIYENNGESVYDSGVVEEGKNIYYTVFAYDTHGNISSGAVIAYRGGGSTTVEEIATTTNPLQLTLADVEFIQDGTLLPMRGQEVVINGAKQLTLRIPYERLPEHLKSILVTFTSPDDPEKEFRFLLRVTKEKDAYTAILAPFGVRGTFPFRISVLDYTTMQIGYVSGELVSEITTYTTASTDGAGIFVGMVRYIFVEYQTIVLMLFLCLLVVLGFVSRRFFHTE